MNPVDLLGAEISIRVRIGMTHPYIEECGPLSLPETPMLTGRESFHRRNNSFREHNTLFSADKQPCSFYTHNTAHAEYR